VGQKTIKGNVFFVGKSVLCWSSGCGWLGTGAHDKNTMQ